ncbi:MAG: NTP transferase domain-containing protein [Acidobacteriaceae bacterium]|nr:NTP transferase domain-containing protein [Acidobacteriaceae bacterium]
MNLVMPMAGRGSRFAREGILTPKPLVELGGKPFFWWAVESIRRSAPGGALEQISFVVLEEHIERFHIDQTILGFYPEAKVIAIPEVTAGSAETAAIGLRVIDNSAPVAINDCDHAFLTGPLEETIHALTHGNASAALMTFQSSNPGFSYVRFDENGKIIGTVEKQVVSTYAIAGCYLFRSAALYLQHYEQYLKSCSYQELFISGIYNNEILASGGNVKLHSLLDHFPFGTPEEYRAVEQRMLTALGAWIGRPSHNA